MVERFLTETGVDQEGRFRPSITAIVGPPLHGKTTLGRDLARSSNLALLDLDEARASIFPDRIVGQILPANQERFVMLTSYQYMHERARDMVKSGAPVVIAGAYTREIYHEMLYDLANRSNVPLMVVYLDCSEDEVRRRLVSRSSDNHLSNIKTFEQYMAIKDRYRKMAIPNLISINSEMPVAECVQAVLSWLSDIKTTEQQMLQA